MFLDSKKRMFSDRIAGRLLGELWGKLAQFGPSNKNGKVWQEDIHPALDSKEDEQLKAQVNSIQMLHDERSIHIYHCRYVTCKPATKSPSTRNADFSAVSVLSVKTVHFFLFLQFYWYDPNPLHSNYNPKSNPINQTLTPIWLRPTTNIK